MTRIIESENRVFELIVTPGDEVPGRVKRSARITQLSGEPLTNEQWLAIGPKLIAELVSRGVDVIGWAAN